MLPRNPLPDVFFQKVHYSEQLPPSAPVDLHAFGYYRDLTPAIVDPVIKKEIEKFMQKFRAEEDFYVDYNLRENPVVWYNRRSTPSSSRTTEATPSNSSAQQEQTSNYQSTRTSEATPSNSSAKQEQTSKCNRCKMLSKIKKAKFKLRYKFMTMKLEQNASTLQSLRNFIASAEGKLRNKGRSDEVLKDLRNAMGIDRFRVENLADINRKFFKAAEKASEE